MVVWRWHSLIYAILEHSHAGMLVVAVLHHKIEVWGACKGYTVQFDFFSNNPANGEIVWQGISANDAACIAAVGKARAAYRNWSAVALSDRVTIAIRFAEQVTQNGDALANMIMAETGKPLWEARTEVSSIAAKVNVSIRAYNDRTGEKTEDAAFGRMILRHRPHGVLAVLGPYNFPGHLPTGHIVPALLAGNCVVFKPSEMAPATGEMLVEFWRAAGLPEGVLELVQGGRETGAHLLDADIDGLLFTGSAKAGLSFQQRFAGRPGFILALELGGNNPIIYWDGDVAAAASIVIQSAFVSAGQRCSCARRLIVRAGSEGSALIAEVKALAERLRIGPGDATPAPFMGPLVSDAAADAAMNGFHQYEKNGGVVVLRPLQTGPTRAFMTPGIIDMTNAKRIDAEVFGPVLQVIQVPDFEAALNEANATAYGLSAAFVSHDDALWEQFLLRTRAGVVNRNRPTNGASSSMPFGGLGMSGNHRPSAYYAADYCAYPVASAESVRVEDLTPSFAEYLED
jgi:succinylglutamic semialdehyde dehydrogenase